MPASANAERIKMSQSFWIIVSLGLLLLAAVFALQAHLARTVAARLISDDIYYYEVRNELLRKIEDGNMDDTPILLQQTHSGLFSKSRHCPVNLIWRPAVRVFFRYYAPVDTRDIAIKYSGELDGATTTYSATLNAAQAARAKSR